MKIAVASGKGGTGKSTVAVNVSLLLSRAFGDVCLVDCDVEEPNCHIFLQPGYMERRDAFAPVPVIHEQECAFCGRCLDVCQFNALARTRNTVMSFPELCHGCGACTLVCPSKAITEGRKMIGSIGRGVRENLSFVTGELRIGEPMAPPLIRQVRQEAASHAIQVLDCPPGTSCPMVSAVDGADLVLLVAEPTPFGLYDLQLAVKVVRTMQLPHVIVLNKSGSDDEIVRQFAVQESVEVVCAIPEDRGVAQVIARGEIVIDALPEYRVYFEPVLSVIGDMLHG